MSGPAQPNRPAFVAKQSTLNLALSAQWMCAIAAAKPHAKLWTPISQILARLEIGIPQTSSPASCRTGQLSTVVIHPPLPSVIPPVCTPCLSPCSLPIPGSSALSS